MNSDLEKSAQAACVVLYNPALDGSVLAIERSGKSHDYGLPGGKVEKGEHPADAAIRELFEETGLIVEKKNLNLVYCGYNNNTIVATYVATKLYGGTLHPQTREGTPVWINPNMLLGEDCSYRVYNQIIFVDILG